MANKDIAKTQGFHHMTKEELSVMNSQTGKKPQGQQIRRFREQNPDIAALMDAYKINDREGVMNKYIADNEKFAELYKQAKTPTGKAKIWGQYQGFQLKIFELMFGTKSTNLNLDVDVGSARNMEEIWNKTKKKEKEKIK